MVLRSTKSVPTPKQNKAIRSPKNGKSLSSGTPTSPNVAKNRRKGKDSSLKSPQPKTSKRRPNSAASSKTLRRISASDAVEEPLSRVIKPENQLELTENELQEDITRILTGDDPNLPKNVCRFSFKDRCYKPEPPGQGDNMAVHFSLEGCIMHVNSDEYKKLKAEREADATLLLPDVHEGESSEADGATITKLMKKTAPPSHLWQLLTLLVKS